MVGGIDRGNRDKLRVVMVHARYTQTGGEESIFESEATLLEEHGHVVYRYSVLNSAFSDINPVVGAAKTVWNHREFRLIRTFIKEHQPNVVHFHNTFPAISPSGYYAAKAERVPIVQSLHNYRLFCVNAFCFRDGAPCIDCMNRFVSWPGIVHSCHPRGRAVSASVAALQSVHRLAGTWHRMVDVYIVAATQFATEILIASGIPSEKAITKPNFLDPDPGFHLGGGGYALFVGRISAEKGIETLLRAWEQLPDDIPLRIIGDGPLADLVRSADRERSNVEWLGRRPLSEVVHAMGNAEALVFPSQWFEGMPRTIIESFAVGTPVIASDVGGLPEMVTHGRTGLVFPSGDANVLASTMRDFFSPANNRAEFRGHAREAFEERYTAKVNYQQLIAAYEKAIQTSRRTTD